MAVKILITLDGGLVQDIHCDTAHEVVVVDYDTEGGEPEEIEKLPGGEAYVSRWDKHPDNHLEAVNWPEVFPECP